MRVLIMSDMEGVSGIVTWSQVTGGHQMYEEGRRLYTEEINAAVRGAKRAGRSIDDIDRPQLMICSVDNDRKKALDGARKMMTQYLGQQPHLMKASGVSQELLDEIHQVLTWPATDEEIENAMHLVPDDVVQMCTASGSPEEVKAKVREYIDHGCTCPILYPLGDPRLMIDIFSEGYS